MPAGNGTGPMGQGPMTGRGAGFCAGYDAPGLTKGYGRGMGRGFGPGRGRGRGMGYRHRWQEWPETTPSAFHTAARSLSKENEITMLKTQAENLKRAQEELQNRLDELEKQG